MKTAGVVMALLLGLALAGCGSDDEPEAATAPSSSSPTSQGPKTFSSVGELKDAAVAAGLACPSWKQDNVVQAAAESGTCSDETVLSTYATDADLQTAIGNLRDINELMKEQKLEPTPILIGPNWIINAPDAPSLTGALGGTVDR